MKFIVIQDTSNNLCTWKLTTNAGAILATAGTYYNNLPDVQASIKAFKTWVGQAPISVVQHQDQDWQQQAKMQLKAWKAAQNLHT